MEPFIKIEVKKNGLWESLNLGLNPRWNFVINNPLFRKDKIPGFTSFPINIPYSGNAKCLGYPNVFSSMVKKKKVEARIKLFGGTWCCGFLLVKKADCNNIRVQFQDNQGDFKSKIDGIKLRDICQEQHTIPCGEIFCQTWQIVEYIENELPSNFDLSFTINGIIYTLNYSGGNAPPTALGILQDLAQLVNSDSANNISSISFNEISPTNAEITFCSVDNFTVTGDFSGIPAIWDFVNSVITNDDLAECWRNYLQNLINQQGKQSHVFPPIYAPNLFGNENPNWNGFLNYFSSPFYAVNPVGTVNDPAFAFAPQISLSWLLECIQDFTGYKFKGDILQDDCFCKIYLKSNILIEDFIPTSYNLADHVPDITIIDLLNAIQKMGIALKFDKFDKCIEFTQIEDSLNQAPKNANSKIICSTGKVCYNENNGFTLEFPKPSGDDFKYQNDDVFNSVVLGEGEEKITMCYTPLANYEGTWAGSKNWITPCFDGKGSTNLYGIGENNCGVRFFFYHGLQPSSVAASTYPMASSCEYNIQGDQLCRFSLKLEGENGIYETFYKKWLQVLQEPTIEISVLPDTKMIGNYDHCDRFELTIEGTKGCFFLKYLQLNVNDCGFNKGKAVLVPTY